MFKLPDFTKITSTDVYVARLMALKGGTKRTLSDELHYLRVWTIPQALRRLGLLHEGWNPDADRYEHTFGIGRLSFVFKSVDLFTVPDEKGVAQKLLPFIRQQVMNPSRPWLRAYTVKRYELWTQDKGTQRFSSASQLWKELKIARARLSDWAEDRYQNARSDRRIAAKEARRRDDEVTLGALNGSKISLSDFVPLDLVVTDLASGKMSCYKPLGITGMLKASNYRAAADFWDAPTPNEGSCTTH